MEYLGDERSPDGSQHEIVIALEEFLVLNDAFHIDKEGHQLLCEKEAFSEENDGLVLSV